MHEVEFSRDHCIHVHWDVVAVNLLIEKHEVRHFVALDRLPFPQLKDWWGQSDGFDVFGLVGDRDSKGLRHIVGRKILDILVEGAD